MFSYVPFHNDQPYSRSRQNLYAQQLARQRAQYAAALRTQRARELAFAQSQPSWLSARPYQDHDDDDDGRDFIYGHGPSQRRNAYEEAKQRQEAIETACTRLQAEEEKRRGQESYQRALDEVRQRNNEEEEMRGEDGEKQMPETPAAAMLVTPDTPPSTSATPAPSSLLITPEELDAAAQKIQSFFHQRKSVASIKVLNERFNELKRQFHFPSKVDFVESLGQIITVDVLPIGLEPSSSADNESNTVFKLAYTAINGPIHMYNEELSRLLVSLDAIESWGAKSVREQRREVVRRIETEARRVESICERIWNISRNGMVQDELEGAADSPQVDPDTTNDNVEKIQAVDAQVVREETQHMQEIEDTKAETAEVDADATNEEMGYMEEVEGAKGETESVVDVDANTAKEGMDEVEAFKADSERTEEVDVDMAKEETAKMDGADVADVKGEDDAEMAEVESSLATVTEGPSLEDVLLTSES